jgi:hypothetical protein
MAVGLEEDVSNMAPSIESSQCVTFAALLQDYGDCRSVLAAAGTGVQIAIEPQRDG